MKAESTPSATGESTLKHAGDRHEGGPHGRPRPGRRFHRLLISAALIVAVLAVGIGGAAWLAGTRTQPPRRENTVLPPLVEVQTLARRDLREVFDGYGSARADREVELSAEVSGRIVEIPEDLKDGSPVAQGQTLVVIDDREYRRLLAQADGLLADVQADLEKLQVEKDNAERLAAIAAEEVAVTRDEYQRLTDLYEKQSASKKEWDFSRLAHQRTRRDLQALENEVALIEPRRAKFQALRDSRLASRQLAELSVERCTIKSPWAGRVEEIRLEVGDRAEVGSPVMRLIDPDYIEVPIELPASVYSRTQVGASCLLSMDSLPGVQWEAAIRRISPVADRQSRTFTAYVEVDNATQEIPLVPGYFLTAKVPGPLRRQVLAVPRGAIVDHQVFIINDDTAHVRAVSVECLIGDQAVVSGDLAAGDRVILTNLDMLHDGTPVRWHDRASTAARQSTGPTAEAER